MNEAPDYAFPHSAEDESRRLDLFQQRLDPLTIRRVERLGLGAGSRCLEIGGGRGSITQWLSERVGPHGGVTATDLQVDFLNSIAAPNIEVLRHDLRTDTFPESSFDLVHARAVLMHIPDDPEILRRMVVVAPSGWMAAARRARLRHVALRFRSRLVDAPRRLAPDLPERVALQRADAAQTDPPTRTRRCRRRRRTRRHRGRIAPRRVLSPEHGRNRTAGDRRRRSHSRTGNRSHRSTQRSGLPRVRLRPHSPLGRRGTAPGHALGERPLERCARRAAELLDDVRHRLDLGRREPQEQPLVRVDPADEEPLAVLGDRQRPEVARAPSRGSAARRAWSRPGTARGRCAGSRSSSGSG